MRRLPATPTFIPKWMNVIRAVSSEGWGRIKYHTMLRGRLDTDRELRGFLDGEHTKIPEFYRERITRELGYFAEWLPKGALEHDQNAYLKSEAALVPIRARAGRAAPAA
jgi:hypothetical protein